MLIITATFKRPSPKVPFFPTDASWQAAWDSLIEEQVSAGIMTRPEGFRVTSSDQLELKIVSNWRSTVDNFNFLGKTEVVEIMEQRDAYFTTNGIIAEFHREIITDEYDQG